jgi:transposase-like protein
LPTSTLANWVKAAKPGKLEKIGKIYRPLTEVEIELTRVKKENAILKMECEIIKKPAAHCARESLRGTR